MAPKKGKQVETQLELNWRLDDIGGHLNTRLSLWQHLWCSA